MLCSTTCTSAALESESHTATSQGPRISYTDKQCWRFILCSKDVQLIKPEYLIYLHNHGLRMPMCQDVLVEWIIDVDGQLDWDQLVIIAVSYCWINKNHPDPDGYHLRTLFHLCSAFIAGSLRTAKYSYDVPGSSYIYSANCLINQGWCIGSGDGRPVGIFIDWMSIPQDKPDGSRTQTQTAVFNRSLKSINIWYGHEDTITWRLTSLPSGADRTGYDESGWPTFERCIAGIISSQSKMLLIDERARSALETANGDYLQVSLDYIDRTREAPITPEAFNTLIQSKVFTNGSDKDRIVIPRYHDTFMAVIGDATALKLQSLGFGDPQARQTMALARTYGQVRVLDLSKNEISIPLEDWAELAIDLQLTMLKVSENLRLSGDLQAVQPLVKLTILGLGGTRISGDLQAVQPLVELTDLRLGDTRISGDLQAVQPLVKLTILGLGGTRISGDLQAVQPLVELTYLWLNGTQISGDLQAVQPLVNLVHMDLDGTRVSGRNRWRFMNCSGFCRRK